MIPAAETTVRVAGGLAFATAWSAGAAGALAAHRRRQGRASGLAIGLRATGAYGAVAVPYLATCVVLWRPLPITLSSPLRWTSLTLGAILGAIGAVAYLWGRATLGSMYNVSSAVGSELFEHHELVVRGPYRIVRHPMYVGLVCAATGALLVYRMWTSLFMLACLPGAVLKARREDRLLAAEFGDRFAQYRRDVPGWIPRRALPHRAGPNQSHRSSTTQEVPRCPLPGSVKPY